MDGMLWTWRYHSCYIHRTVCAVLFKYSYLFVFTPNNRMSVRSSEFGSRLVCGIHRSFFFVVVLVQRMGSEGWFCTLVKVSMEGLC